MNQKNTKLGKEGQREGTGARVLQSYRPSGARATHLSSHVRVSEILQSLCSRIRTHKHTRSTANPPLPLTNERIITFADMRRGGGEADEGGTVHLSKQEMNSPCCGHLSPGRGRGGWCVGWLLSHPATL